MSEYLGWNERKVDRQFDPTRVDRNDIAGGPMTQSYDALVRNIFRPEKCSQEASSFLPPSFAPPSALGMPQQQLGGQQNANPLLMTPGQKILASQERPKISAAAMKRIEEQLGKDALDETYDDELWKSPLDEIYAELGIADNSLSPFSSPFASSAASGIRSRHRPAPGLESEYSVYAPKSSSEYFSTANSSPPAQSSYRSSTLGSYRLATPSSLRSAGPSNTFREKSDEEWRKTNRQHLVDYKDFDSAPLSPYMYHGGVRRQDSRIVGSNFVQVTSRPKDRFLEKIDQTLAEIRSSPRYTFN